MAPSIQKGRRCLFIRKEKIMEYEVKSIRHENKSYYHVVEADGCELVVAISEHFCERLVHRLASLGIFYNEDVCKYALDAIFKSGMGDYLLWEVPCDNKRRSYLVLDKMHEIIYAIEKGGDEIVIKTSLSPYKKVIAYDPEDTLLCVEQDGNTHETSEEEEPRFVCKKK